MRFSSRATAMVVNRVLVKEVNWLGDLVMSYPALKAVRDAFPAARLAVLVKHDLAGFFDGVRWVDEVIPYTLAAGLRGLADRRRIISEIRARRFDLAVLFPNSFDAALWAALGRVPRRVGFASDGRGWLLTDKTRPDDHTPRSHQAFSYLQMLRDTLGIAAAAADYPLEVAERHRVTMRAWLEAHRRRPHGRLIALAPAAAFGPAKEWPVGHYAALIDLLAERYGAESVLLGSPSERGKCEAVAAAAADRALVAAGTTGVAAALALLSLCDGFAGNDSGAMHVAAALGIPTVGMFGSTDPHRTGPRGLRAKVLYHALDCSPCLQRTCRFGHYNCLTQISPSAVARALETLGAFG